MTSQTSRTSKSNPNLGVSLSADYLADQVTDAKNRPEAVRNVMTKNVNLCALNLEKV